MKKTFNKNLTQWVSFVVILWIVSFTAASKPIKNHDQSLKINTHEGCVVSISLNPGIDNCAESEFKDSCGRNGKDCVCMRKNKTLTWGIDNGSNFQIQFPNASPNSRCKLKTKQNPTVKCKIAKNSGDFKYNVIVDSCPGVVYDPVIVVRN